MYICNWITGANYLRISIKYFKSSSLDYAKFSPKDLIMRMRSVPASVAQLDAHPTGDH